MQRPQFPLLACVLFCLVLVSGNVGYAASGLPSAGFRTAYRRDDQAGEGPQVAMTVRQIYLPSLMGSGPAGSNTPTLRTASISSYDKMEVLDVIHLEYGASLESISLFGRMNHVSPFARATYALGDQSAAQVAVSAGSQPVELIGGSPDQNQNLNGDLAALGRSPLPHDRRQPERRQPVRLVPPL